MKIPLELSPVNFASRFLFIVLLDDLSLHFVCTVYSFNQFKLLASSVFADVFKDTIQGTARLFSVQYLFG